jgi:hypothetical protein
MYCLWRGSEEFLYTVAIAEDPSLYFSATSKLQHNCPLFARGSTVLSGKFYAIFYFLAAVDL